MNSAVVGNSKGAAGDARMTLAAGRHRMRSFVRRQEKVRGQQP